MKTHQDISAACIYLLSKLSAFPTSPRSITNVYAYLSSTPAPRLATSDTSKHADPDSYYVSESTYYTQRALLTKHETIILRTLGFQTHVALPHTLCINYLQALEVFHHEAGKKLANRVFAHLNTTLLSPQMVYLTHQPPTLATAAIYLAAREVGVKLPEEEWWEVFDTDREELGFLVVAMLSMEGFVRGEYEKWGTRRVPMTVAAVEKELELMKLSEEGNAIVVRD